MKCFNVVFSALCLSSVFTAVAQTSYAPPSEELSILDTVKCLATYQVMHVWNPEFPESLNTDTMLLQVGTKVSRCYDVTEHQEDLKAMDKRKRNDHRGGINIVASARFGDIFRNYPDKKLTVVNDYDFVGVFKYQEDIPDFKWKIENEKKTVLGYTCQKATCKFRGRNYTAWFADKIPLPNGPWKFGGLPGLILEVTDSENHFRFTCVSVGQPHEKTDITFWNRKCKEITREKYLSMEAKALNRPADFYTSLGARTNLEADFSWPSNVLEKK